MLPKSNNTSFCLKSDDFQKSHQIFGLPLKEKLLRINCHLSANLVTLIESMEANNKSQTGFDASPRDQGSIP